MRILQICNYLYPHIGGIEQVTRDVAGVIRAEGHEQVILCFNEDAAADGKVCRRKETAEDTVDGVRVVRCACAAKLRSQSVSFPFRRELRKTLDAFRPDTVIFHYPNPWQAFFLLRELPENTRLILWWHLDIVKQKILGKAFAGQNRRLLARAGTVVATSPLYIGGSPWLSGVRDKCIVIPNCVDEERLKPDPASARIAAEIRKAGEGKVLCFAAGRHVPYKGIRYLVEASKLLDDRFAIRIAGSGEETENLKELAKGDPKVVFLGRVSDEELKANLMAADIFCFPSITKNEAFGIALAEAMYCGKPCVTFTIPGSGVNYVSIGGETGIEVPNRDTAAYAEALKKLADDPALLREMGKAAKNRAETCFLFPSFREKVRELLEP